MKSSGKNILVAYFSHPGQNYANGSIIDLKKGNTAIAAEKLAALTGGALFEIRTAQAYPYDYRECVDVAKEELRLNSRPELAETIDTSGYDAIILGYPNWCGTLPMAVCTFLEGRDLAGKAVLPFCTNEGSGMGRSEGDLKRLCPGADLRPGLAVHGSSAAEAGPALERWLRKSLG